MSKVVAKQRTKRLSEANAEAQAAMKGSKGIDKRVTTFKGDTAATKDSSGDGGTGAIDFAPMAPNDEQLAKINQFTRSPKTADDLVVFPTLSCNDLYDRDDERFVTDTVKQFATLADPYGSVGKSYMVGHDYTKLPVGRIFDVGTKTVNLDTLTSKSATDGATMDTTSKATFLTNWVYVPKTAANQSFIENLDFGVNWAVSVGVMLEEAKCSLSFCGAPMMMSRFFGAWCSAGHDKGYYYIEDAEEDSWGYPSPCAPEEKGAEKCRTDLYGAKDFYELSQVFLGAQFFAAVSDKATKGIMKAASAYKVPIIGLSAKEAEVFEKVMPHLPEAAVKAMRDRGARPDEDGTLKWTDDTGLVWTFNPAEDTEVMCLGKAIEEGKEGNNGEEPAQGQPDAESLREGAGEQQDDSGVVAADEREGDDPEDGGLGSDEVTEGVGEAGSVADKASDSGHTHSHTHSDTNTTHSHKHTHNGDNAYQHATSDNVTHAHGHNSEGKEATVSKQAVVEVLKSLDVPEAVLRAVESAKGNSLDTALRPLAEKAALGDQFIQTKRADAIAWYVKAQQTEPNTPVSTDTFQKMLEAVGDNVELIDALTDQQKQLAQAKFPVAVRRSSFPTDPNTATEPSNLKGLDEGVSEGGNRTVKRLHG